MMSSMVTTASWAATPIGKPVSRPVPMYFTDPSAFSMDRCAHGSSVWSSAAPGLSISSSARPNSPSDCEIVQL
jgi:hypothetical protein